MNYIFKKKLNVPFEQAVKHASEELKKAGFGILTEIDVKATLKKKLDIDFRNYHILGACNPTYAHKALQTEPWVGAMLPCNLVVQEFSNGDVEVGAVNPIASMQAIDNPALSEVAQVIQAKLQTIIQNL